MAVLCDRNNVQGLNNFWSEDSIPESTPMRDFYRNKIILLTGGTGSLGQIYVAKLLR